MARLLVCGTGAKGCQIIPPMHADMVSRFAYLPGDGYGLVEPRKSQEETNFFSPPQPLGVLD